MAVGTPTSVMAASWARAKAPRALGLGYPPLPGTNGGSPTITSPTFPQAPLGVEVDLWTGVWTAISQYVYQRDPINITAGRQNEASQVNPSECNLTLKNSDGRFSFNNPLGAYYGSLTRNAPLRLSVPTSVLPSPYNTSYLRIEDDATSYASCPASTGLQQVTGSFDVRVDVDLTGYGQVTLAAVWSAAGGVDQRCWKLGMLTTGQVNLDWSTAGTSGSVLAATSSAQTPLPFGRLVIRATMDATTGNVTFYTGPAGGIDSGPWTQLGSTIAGAGATSVFASASAGMTVGYNAGLNYDNSAIGGPTGAFYDAELRNGINGTVVAKPGFNTLPASTTSWVDAAGNIWTPSGTAEVSLRCYRFHGEFAGVPKASDPTVTDVYTQATAAGVLRRLSQGQSPLNSPLYRAYVRLTGVGAPVAYWPCEDGTQASQIASGLPNGTPMMVNGSPQFASNSGFVGSDALPVFNGSAWAGTVPAQASWSANNVSFLFQAPSGGDTDGGVIARITCTGTVTRIDLVYNTASGGEFTLNCYGGGTLLGTSGAVTVTGGANGVPWNCTVALAPSGGQLVGTFTATPTYPAQVIVSGNTPLFAGTVGAIVAVQINPGGVLTGSAVGHVAVGSAAIPPSSYVSNAMYAWLAETAAARVARLCTEEGIAYRIYGHIGLSTVMGYQSISTLTELLQECEDTDRGMLYEPPTCLGVGYRTVASMYNQTATATVSFSGAGLDQGLVPTTDDLMTQNDVTANNLDGSSARQVLAIGTMSIQAPPNGIGRADTSISVNTWPDTTLPSIANWAVHIGTDPRDRFPTLPFNLARSETPNSIALLRIGDLHTVTSPPTWVQYDEIDQLVAGRSETLGPLAVWQIDTNAIPAYPYVIAEIAGGVSPATHVDTDGTTLTSDVTSSATAFSFTTTDPSMPPWTVAPTDYPFDVAIGGERVTITSPGTGRNADPLLQGLSTYTADNASIALSSSMGVPEAARGYSTQVILVTPAGSPATEADVHGAAMGAGSIGTNAAYTVWAWVYGTQARTYQLFANWLLSGAYVSTTIATGTAVSAGVWTLLTASITSPAAGINQAQWGVTDQSSPTSAMTFGVWGVQAARTSNISSSSPQTMTGVRSVNGVVKAQSAGSDVRLWFPPIVGL